MESNYSLHVCTQNYFPVYNFSKQTTTSNTQHPQYNEPPGEMETYTADV